MCVSPDFSSRRQHLHSQCKGRRGRYENPLLLKVFATAHLAATQNIDCFDTDWFSSTAPITAFALALVAVSVFIQIGHNANNNDSYSSSAPFLSGVRALMISFDRKRGFRKSYGVHQPSIILQPYLGLTTRSGMLLIRQQPSFLRHSDAQLPVDHVPTPGWRSLIPTKRLLLMTLIGVHLTHPGPHCTNRAYHQDLLVQIPIHSVALNRSASDLIIPY